MKNNKGVCDMEETYLLIWGDGRIEKTGDLDFNYEILNSCVKCGDLRIIDMNFGEMLDMNVDEWVSIPTRRQLCM